MLNKMITVITGIFLICGNAYSAGESYSNRSGKQFCLFEELVGHCSPWFIRSKCGLLFKPRGLFEFTYVSGSASLLDTSIESSFTSLGYKYFFGNSFYGHIGLGSAYDSVHRNGLNYKPRGLNRGE